MSNKIKLSIIFAVLIIAIGAVYGIYQYSKQKNLSGKPITILPNSTSTLVSSSTFVQNDLHAQTQSLYDKNGMITDKSIEGLPSVVYSYQDKILRVVQNLVLLKSINENSYKILTKVSYGNYNFDSELGTLLPTASPVVRVIKHSYGYCDFVCNQIYTFVNLQANTWLSIIYAKTVDDVISIAVVSSTDSLTKPIRPLISNDCNFEATKKDEQKKPQIVGAENANNDSQNQIWQKYLFSQPIQLTCVKQHELGPWYEEEFKSELESLNPDFSTLNINFSGKDAFGKSWKRRFAYKIAENKIVDYMGEPTLNLFNEEIKKLLN